MAMGSVVHLLFFLSEQCYLMPFSTYRIGTGLSANPVCGKLPGMKVNCYRQPLVDQSSIAMAFCPLASVMVVPSIR
ncbi:hypothetical protein CI675_0024000 (plasmid) [Escherichia coli]|uniref:hypothetical protein n=1 Tax=Escherichia coli TaxID=562 RepID=UPI001163EC77|nr:hypothetical protein [Escherichia coli]QDJ90420.1 hypothetical protein CI675_0024000 [Escherichia coli]